MQKSKTNWIIHADRNTKCYHIVTTRKRIRRRIHGIFNIQGEWVEDHKGISKIFYDYFRSVFSKPDTISEDSIITRLRSLKIPLLNDTHKEWLSEPLKPDEVKIAAFQIGPLKA